MTREEKIKFLNNYCRNTRICPKCPLYVLHVPHLNFEGMSDWGLEIAKRLVEASSQDENISTLEEFETEGILIHVTGTEANRVSNIEIYFKEEK